MQLSPPPERHPSARLSNSKKKPLKSSNQRTPCNSTESRLRLLGRKKRNLSPALSIQMPVAPRHKPPGHCAGPARTQTYPRCRGTRTGTPAGWTGPNGSQFDRRPSSVIPFFMGRVIRAKPNASDAIKTGQVIVLSQQHWGGSPTPRNALRIWSPAGHAGGEVGPGHWGLQSAVDLLHQPRKQTAERRAEGGKREWR